MTSLSRRHLGNCVLTALAATLLPLHGDDAKVDYALDEIAPSLVKISYQVDGKAKSGNGVIVQMDGKPYLLTNQHIILGADKISFVTASGKRLAPRSVELSANRDLARLALMEGPSLTISALAGMNTPVAVFSGGNGKKQHVEHGKIIGVGSGKIEVSATFDDSFTGAPALNANKEVVGIASYSQESARHAMKAGTRFDESTRHFCYRVGKGGWKRVNWKTYNNKYGKAYRKHDTFCASILEIFENGESFNASVKQARKLASECRTHVRQLRMLTEHRDLTEFLLNEFEGQAELLEYAEELFLDYAKSRS